MSKLVPRYNQKFEISITRNFEIFITRYLKRKEKVTLIIFASK